MIESWEAGRACPVRGDRRSPPVADSHPRYGAQLSLTTSVGGNIMFGVSVPRLTRSTKSAEAEVDLTPASRGAEETRGRRNSGGNRPVLCRLPFDDLPDGTGAKSRRWGSAEPIEGNAHVLEQDRGLNPIGGRHLVELNKSCPQFARLWRLSGAC